MIKNTEVFFRKSMEFQEKRTKLVAEYEGKIKALEKYQGSKGYKKDMEKIQKDHREALEALQKEYRPTLMTIIDGMKDGLGRRKISPPTNEQLNLIHLLKMKKEVTSEDLDRVANMMDGNSVALGVIQEIAKEAGVRRSYMGLSSEMSSQTADEIIREMRVRTEDWLQHDTKKAPRLANKYYSEMYGVTRPDHELPKRDTFSDADGCYAELACLDHEGLQMFSQAVDNE